MFCPSLKDQVSFSALERAEGGEGPGDIAVLITDKALSVLSSEPKGVKPFNALTPFVLNPTTFSALERAEGGEA